MRADRNNHFTGLVLACLGVVTLTAQTVPLHDIPVVTEDAAYSETDKSILGYLVRPEDDKKHPAVILIHEWWGLNETIKENARMFAALGYVALAVDLYEGQVAATPAKARELAGEVSNNMESAFANLEQAVNFLENDTVHVIPDRLASIGWCFGGGWSYQMAKNDLGVKASVIYYGRFNPEDDLSKMRASILGHFGEKDRGIRIDTVTEFQAKLKTLNGKHEIYIYPNVGHAFANPGGQNYDEEMAELAWKRTSSFLKKYL
ncbi:MAG: dienelactone hydrolase family protein [Candidatus Neomarinimicrobiota bacterium]